ncbi:MAG TPA: ComF family protein [Sulfurovum sp.]|nr:ComF family protein [Sulfurovum sp.]
MRCLSCHRFSVPIICKSCDQKLLVPNITKRKIGTLEVISLFKYKNIESFLLTKHTPVGFRIYKYFGKKFITPFIDKFAKEAREELGLISIDEQVHSGYAHTALLSHFVDNSFVGVQHSKLLAKNSVNYAGKSLQYRLENPRNFQYTGKKDIQVILIDDIITTGVTLQEAQIELKRHGVDVLFAVTLADARE